MTVKNSEMFALHSHYVGHGGEYLLAAYDAVATTTGEPHTVALRQLDALPAHAPEARR